MNFKTSFYITASLIGITLISGVAHAAISMDRTRIIFDGGQKSISINVENNNKQLPYLAQSWIEDLDGKKIQSPLVVLPPVQRIEPGKSSQLKIESLPAVNALPQDRESMFYFNLREIPPKSDKPNTLQIALQTRVKLFYRPKAIIPESGKTPWQNKLTLEKQGEQYIVKNPTPYYITIINATNDSKIGTATDFAPVMIAPFGQDNLGVNTNQVGNKPVLTYINDYGGRPALKFSCQASNCQVIPDTQEP